MMDKCALCPRKCGVNRDGGQKGIRETAGEMFVAAFIRAKNLL
jgi:uncharacterized Fe-S radical SAM superfamily protein PflX